MLACQVGHRKADEPEYDKQTGKLQLLKYDSDGNGKVDTFSYMDGPGSSASRSTRTRTERSIAGSTTAPTRSSRRSDFPRRQDGKEDAWSYSDAAGAIDTHRDLDQARRQDHAHRALREGRRSSAPRKTATATARSTSGKPTTATISRRSRSTPSTAAHPTGGWSTPPTEPFESKWISRAMVTLSRQAARLMAPRK